eukprot:Anaeramoba_ignava/a243232_6.p1 GENE.a243232_6~~a243232_6.p1  ORF type:complete len:123 (-),score=10.28 a243232_6:678-1046(-)
MVTALVSLMSGVPIQHNVGMTGEITLRGQVMPVGGVKEKVLAAHRAGLRKIILPKRNEVDLEDLPKEVLEDLEFCLVEMMDEVLKEALESKSSVNKPEETTSTTGKESTQKSNKKKQRKNEK